MNIWARLGLTALFTLALTLFAMDGLYQPRVVHSAITPTTPPTSASGSWTNPTNALTSNTSYATYTGTARPYLTLTNYALGIPAGSAINGIQVTVKGLSSGTNATNRTIQVGVTKNGTAVVGTAKTQALNTTDASFTLGTTSDLWGTTWATTDVNATTFGVMLRDNDTTSSGTFSIDVVTVAVTYTPPVNGTTATALSYSGVTTSDITVSAPFSGDDNSNNSCTIRWGTSAGSYPNTATATRGAGAYTATVNGLSAGTTYYFEATFADADGLAGSPQSGSQSTLAINDTTAGALTFSNVTDSAITVSAPFTGDQNGNNGCVVMWGTTAGSYPNSAPAATRNAGAFSTTVSGLSTNTTYYFQATLTDSDGVTGSPVTASQATVDPSAALLHNGVNLGSTKWGGNWGVAGGQYGEFTCNTCHTMDTNNIKGIVQSIPATIGPNVAKPINFLNLTSFGNDSKARTASDRICEACHTQTDYHRYDTTAQPSMTHPNGDCMGCHPHKQGFRAMGCTSCHGHNAASSNPIASGQHTAHISNLATLGANYGCADCHAPTVSGDTAFSNAANHNSGTVNYGGTLAGTINPDKTCTSYCHTNGKGGPATPVNWLSGPALDCKGCHGATGSFGEPDYTTGNSHAKHVSSAADCASCHFATTANGTTIKGSHTNQSIDVNASTNIGYLAGAKTCSSASCHADPYSAGSVTTPAWGTAAGCSACHSVAIGASGPATGSHSLTGHVTACTACHATGTTATTVPSTGHLDGNIDVTSGYPANVTKHAAGTYTGTCSAASCHANVYGTGSVTTPVWGSTGNGCSACHNVAIGASGPATGSHSLTGHVTACTACHATGTTATTVPSTGHADGNIDVANVGYPADVAKHAAGSGYTTCSAASCHANVYGTGSITTPAWGSTGNGCSACHSVAIGASGPATGSHSLTGHVTACTACHATGTTATAAPSTGHADGNIDVANVGYPADVTKHAAGSGYTTCSAASCHANVYGTGSVTTPAWGSTGNGCSACHSVAIGASGPATGSHSLTGHVTACTACHATGTTATTVPSTGHADGNIDVTSGYPANVTKHAAGTYTGTCSAASCHANVYGTGSVTTPVWGSTGNGCSACHSVAIGASGPATGSHSLTGHVTACTACHATGTTATAAPSTGHADGNIDVANVGYPADVTKHAAGSGYTTCSAASCHANVYGTGSVTTPAWGSTGNGCSACHSVAIGASGPATGSHSLAGHVTACTACHATGTTATAVPSTGHADGNIDVANVGYPADVTKHAAGSGYTTCSAASCHANVYGTGSVTTPAWGSTGNGCSACHSVAIGANGPATGSHTVHAGSLCTDCHAAGTTQTAAPSTGHADGNIDVTSGYPANVTKHAAGTYTGTCSAASCHANVYGTGSVTTPVWGSTGNGCSACHSVAIGTDGPATGSHTAHTGAACTACHATGTTATTVPSTGHADGNIDVANVGYPANITKHASGSGYTTCSTASCHANVYGTGTVTTPVWGVDANCSACHTVAIGVNGPNTGSHTAHAGKACTSCHAAGTTATAAPTSGHNDGNIDVTVGGYPATTKHAAGSYTGTCSNISCHSNGYFTPAVVQWGATLNCKGCHATLSAGHTVHVSTLLDDRASTLVYDRYSANASSGTTYKFGCANCHPVNVSMHINGSVDVDLTTTAGSGTLKANNGAASYNGSKQCLNVYCHSNGYATTKVYATTPAWGGSFAGDKCAGCHGNSPSASGQIVGSAAHVKHVVSIHYKGLFNGTNGLLAQSAAKGGAVNAAHGTESRSTTINCNICHNDTVQTSANDGNTACTSCHNGTTAPLKNSGSLIANTAFHVNGQVNVKLAGIKVVSKAQVRPGSFDSYTAAAAGGWSRNKSLYKNYTSAYDVAKQAMATTDWNAATGCSNIACHNGFTVKWTDTVKCQNCHTRL